MHAVMNSNGLVIYCLVPVADEDLVEPLRAHYARDPRVHVILDRRTGVDRRTERAEIPTFDRRTGVDRRRGVVPRTLGKPPPALRGRSGSLRWVQRMVPVHSDGTEQLELEEVVGRVRSHDPEAPTELYWRVHERLQSRLLQLLGDSTAADAAVVIAYGRILDALDDPERESVNFESLIYDEVEELHRTLVPASAGAEHQVGPGLRLVDPALDERVELRPADPGWGGIARAERDRLLRLLGHGVDRIEHVGSTAVLGLAARPIIDLLVGVRRAGVTRELKAGLVAAGYHDCGHAGRKERQYYRRRGPRSPIDIHVIQFEGPLWTEAIAVRDYMRRSPSEAHRFAAAKGRAAREAPDSSLRYAELRSVALTELLRRVAAFAAR